MPHSDEISALVDMNIYLLPGESDQCHLDINHENESGIDFRATPIKDHVKFDQAKKFDR